MEHTNVCFEKGVSFGAVQVQNVESLGAAQAEKLGEGGAFGRHIPVLPVGGWVFSSIFAPRHHS